MRERETSLLQVFVSLLSDHQQSFEGFVRDVENVRFCHTPLDTQQLSRCEYALRNMDMRLLNLQHCIASRAYSGQTLDALVQTRNDWTALKAQVDQYLQEIHAVIGTSEVSLNPIRRQLQTEERA